MKLDREQTKEMVKNAFLFNGPPTSGKTTQTIFLSETVKSKILRGRDVVPGLSSVLESSRTMVPDNTFIPALLDHLHHETSANILLDNIPRTSLQSEALVSWAREYGVNLQLVQFDLTEAQVVDRAASRLVCIDCGESYHPDLKPSKKAGICDIDGTSLAPRSGDNDESLRKGYAEYVAQSEQILNILGTIAHVYIIPVIGNVYETAERMFKAISLVIFYKPEMAEGYFRLRNTLDCLSSRSLFISGMPTFLYGGRALMKDFDILVPDNKITVLADNLQLMVGEKHSSVADTRFVDISPGVEINSGLVVKYPGGVVQFDFDLLWEESKTVRFMGLECQIMGLEDLVLLKAALGRQGTDDFGKFKSDLSDMEGLVGSQQVDWVKLKKRAERMCMLRRLNDQLEKLGQGAL